MWALTKLVVVARSQETGSQFEKHVRGVLKHVFQTVQILRFKSYTRSLVEVIVVLQKNQGADACAASWLGKWVRVVRDGTG